MDDATVSRLQGLDVMILDALRRRPHSTHLSLAESVTLLLKLGARQSFIIHMSHDLDHEQTRRELPDSILVSYDGLRVEVRA